MSGKGHVWWNEECISTLAGERRESLLQLISITDFERHKCNCGLRGGGLRLAPLWYMQRIGDVDQNGNPREARQQFTHDIDLLGS